MIIQFTVGNFLSFKEKVTLSMVKSSIHELQENVIRINDDFELLKSIVIYGANASGKSNLIKAFDFMKNFSVWSFKNSQADERIGILSFVLDQNTKEQPSFFEIVLSTEDILYRYGFEVTNKKVIKEWLYQKTREERLFERNGQEFNLSEKFSEGKNLENKTRDNCLFLSVVSQFNGKISLEIIKCLKKIRVSASLDYRTFYNRTLDRLEKEPELKKDVLRFISVADVAIKDFEIEKEDEPEDKDKPIINKLIRKMVYFVHDYFLDKKAIGGLKFNLDFLESEGTKKMFALSVPIIDALRNGEIIIIDELENHLHPLLLKHIIKLFNSYSNNNNAQLIFTTHNLTCMNKEYFRRDQIWFTEKDSFGESTLFSLAEYKLDDKKIRNDASYSKDYMLGKYGAVPFINDIDLSFKEKNNEPSK